MTKLKNGWIAFNLRTAGAVRRSCENYTPLKTFPTARMIYAMMATQKAWAVINGIATKVPMMASTAKINEMTKTAVVGGDKFISSPPSH
jgi:hypothetical protein